MPVRKVTVLINCLSKLPFDKYDGLVDQYLFRYWVDFSEYVSKKYGFRVNWLDHCCRPVTLRGMLEWLSWRHPNILNILLAEAKRVSKELAKTP